LPEIVHFGASEQPLSPAQLSAWTSGTAGQTVAGGIIQIPALGTGLAIPVINSKITRNGQVVLTDNQLCGVFSGQITQWSQISKVARSSVFNVIYRSDSAGTTFTLTQHLAAVCNSTNSNFPTNFSGTTTFATLFPTGTPPTFIGVKGLAGLANYLNTSTTSAISYLSPDYTTIAPNSDALLTTGLHSTLVVAGLTGAGTKSFLPTITGITAGLNHAGTGSVNATPPASAVAAMNPSNWQPLIPRVTTGYPLVAYANVLMPQCFSNPNVAAGLIAWLNDHYTNAAYQTIENNNGLVRIGHTKASKFVGAVEFNILANSNHWNVNIQNPKICAGLPGR